MNTEMFTRVADAIEKAGRFNLGSFITWTDWDNHETSPTAPDLIHNCDTVGCFAGWVNGIIGEDDARDVETAAAALGIDSLADSDALFYGEKSNTVWDGIEYPYDIKADDAAKMLREIADGTRAFGPGGEGYGA